MLFLKVRGYWWYCQYPKRQNKMFVLEDPGVVVVLPISWGVARIFFWKVGGPRLLAVSQIPGGGEIFFLEGPGVLVVPSIP